MSIEQSKTEIEQEAALLALQLYNLNLEKDKIEKRLGELSVANNLLAQLTTKPKDSPKAKTE